MTTRDKIQQEALVTKNSIQNHGLTLIDKHSNILYEWATGIGKTLLAIKIIEKTNEHWNIVLAEVIHEINWIDEFKKFNKEHLLEKVSFFCYASLHKHTKNTNYIFDEAHHLTSDKRLNLLRQIQSNGVKRIIMLSATLSRSQKIVIKDIIGNFYIDKISLSDAIDKKILPEPTVYFIDVSLDNTKKVYTFNFNKDKSIKCTAKEFYNKSTERIEWLKQKYFTTRQEFDKVKWLSYANKRKQFLSDYKTSYAKILLNKLTDKRLICFTGSIEQSKKLSNGASIHSKLSKQERTELLNSFNNGDINQLFATGMLKEGQNLSNIEAGIIIQLDNTERYFTQVHGRTLRSLFPEQYVLYVKDTQDEVYVETAIENFNKDFVKFISIQEFKETLKELKYL